MVKEYIERGHAVDAVLDVYCDTPDIDLSCEKFEAAILKIPAADVVEVVRCKDCLYSTERYGHMECIHGVSYRNTWNKPDFFCSYGERKEGADNEP